MHQKQDDKGMRSHTNEVSPDSLMSDFRGHSIFGIVTFTAIAHVVIIGGLSIGYLKNELLGESRASLTEDQRMDSAIREATSALRKIAESHGVKPQDLSDRLAGGAKPVTAEPTRTLPANQPATNENNDRPADVPTPTPTPTPTPPESDPPSAIEKQLQETKPGPKLPNLPSLDEEEDLFK